MAKFWQSGDGSATLYRGEALAVLDGLDDGAFDAVITDPPYSSGGFTRGDRAASTGSKYTHTGVKIQRPNFSGDGRSQRAWAYWCALWMSRCHQLVRTSGYFLTFCDWRQLGTACDALEAGGFVLRGVVPWDKGGCARAPHTGYFRHQCEFVVWGTNGVSKPAARGGPWPGFIQATVRQSDKFHLTGKPTAVMRQLVQCVRPGGRVLDPFAGSGTTGVSAIEAGLEFVGVELDGDYFDTAVKRLRAAIKTRDEARAA